MRSPPIVFAVFAAACAACASSSVATDPAVSSDFAPAPLTLPPRPAVARLAPTDFEQAVLTHSPELHAARDLADAARGGADQAGRWPNPRLRLEARDVPREPLAISRGGRWAELSQTIVPGGRLGAAREAGDATHRAQLAVADATVLRVRGELRRACADLVAARAAAGAVAGLARDANELAVAARQRLDRGVGSDAAVADAVADAARHDAELLRRNAETDAASARLASLVPPGVLDLIDVAAWLSDPAALGSPAESPPAVRAAAAQADAARRRVEEARAARVPDIDVSLAAGRAGEDDDGFVEASVTIPLPVFDRNGGRIREAEALARAADAALRQAQRDTALAAEIASARLAGARADAALLRDVAEPAARRALDRATSAWEAGLRPAADVVAARRALLRTVLDGVEADRSARHAEADLIEVLGHVPAGDLR